MKIRCIYEKHKRERETKKIEEWIKKNKLPSWTNGKTLIGGRWVVDYKKQRAIK